MNSLGLASRVSSHAAAGCSRRCPVPLSRPTCPRSKALQLSANAKQNYFKHLQRTAALAEHVWQTERLNSNRVVEQDAVRSWYEALSSGAGALDSLDDIVAHSCTMYSSVDELDTYRLPAVKRELQRLQATHPLLRFEVVSGPEWGAGAIPGTGGVAWW
jgi:hypothetical protein